MKRFFFKNRTHIVVLISYFLINLLFFYPILLDKVNINGHLLVSYFELFGENISYKNIGWDQIRQLYPYISFNLDAIKNLSVPFWNPYIFSGTPHLANLQTSFFYPLSFLGFFLSPHTHWNLMRFSPYFLGAYFTYFYLQEIKLKTLASFFGGLTFGFSLLMITWGEEVVFFPHTIIWLPLILYFIEKYFEKKDKKFLGLLILVTSISIFAGFIQATIYTYVLIVLYLLFRFSYKNLIVTKLGINYFIAFSISILICAIQLGPSLELYFNSAREIYNPAQISNFLNPPQSLLSLFAADIFGNPATWNFSHPGNSNYYESIYFIGIGALIFVIVAIYTRSKNRLIKFYKIAFMISVILSLNFVISKLQIYLKIPFFSSAIPNRILFIGTFSLSVLSAYGANLYLEKKESNILKILPIFISIYAFLIIDLAIIYYFAWNTFNGNFQFAYTSLKNLILPIVIFSLSSLLLFAGNRIIKIKNIVLIVIILFSLLNNFYLAQKFFSFSEKKYIYPQKDIIKFLQQHQGEYRTLNMTNNRLLNNILMQYKIYSPEGYDPSNIKSYLEFISLMNGNKIGNYSRTVAELKISKNPEDFIIDTTQRKLINLLGVKYLIVEKDKVSVLEKGNYIKVFSEESEKGFAVLENPEVLKRAFLVSDFETYQTKNTKNMINNYSQDSLDISSKILSPSFDYKNKIIIEGSKSIFIIKSSEGTADITTYRSNEVLINTRSETPKLLFLSDNYYSGWKATIDGQKTDIIKANYTFRAVYLNEGTHIVRFYYDSDIYKISKYISFVSLLTVFYIYFINNKKIKTKLH